MSEAYLDAALSPEERAEALLEELSLEEKIAQVRGVWGIRAEMWQAQGEAFRQFVRDGIGQVSTLAERECRSLEEAVQVQKLCQDAVRAESPHHIPAAFHMEGLCGAFITGATSFPAGIGRGASFDPALERKIGGTVARQELACGITQVLAPVLDISRDSRMGRQGETYGEDPSLAAAMGAAYTAGVQSAEAGGRHADACAKHFLAFHDSLAGIHGASVEIGEALLREVYAKPFEAAIAESNLRGVMPSYNSVNGMPNSASAEALTGLLRDELKFNGCAISDYGAVGNVHDVQKMAETRAGAGLCCLRAGMDCELPDGSAFGEAEFRQILEQEARRAEEGLRADTTNTERMEGARCGTGQAACAAEASTCTDLQALDQAVLRILTAKFRMGLFEHPYPLEGDALMKAFHHDEDEETTLQSARESLVLLRNDGVLPLRGERVNAAQGTRMKIALIGPHAASARAFFGGYTHLSMVEAIHAVANSTAGVGASGSTEGKEFLHVPGTQIQSDETPEFEALLDWIKPGCPSLLEQLRCDLPEADIRYAHGYYIAGDDESGFEEALKICADADVILLTLGGKHGSCSVASMGEGVDAADINLPAAQDAFMRKAHALGKPMIGLHFNGRPISSDTADACLDAILECWNPSEMGARAISEVLRGVIDPSGRMPVTTARSAGQIPIYYNHPNGSSWHQGDSIGFRNYVDLSHLPRYYFGEGLSYTTFAYSDLVVRAEDDPDQNENRADGREISVDPFGTVGISCRVRNTGDRDGTEVVQLYLQDVYASMTRPVMELAGFCRVALKAGEERLVTFSVAPSQTAFFGADGAWRIEKGAVNVLIGHASNDIRLRGSFAISRTARIEGHDRKFYALGRV